MNKSIYPKSFDHRKFRTEVARYFSESEWEIPFDPKNVTPTIAQKIQKLKRKWVKNLDIFMTMKDEVDWGKDIGTIGSIVSKLLSGETIGKDERRIIRIYMMRQVAYNTHDILRSSQPLQPIVDFFEQEALRLVEKGIVPAFHDFNKPDYKIPDFKWIPGSIQRIHIPVQYGRFCGYVPSKLKNEFVYTDEWVLDEVWNPLFQLNKADHERFIHASGWYLGEDLFLLLHDIWNNEYSWRIRYKTGSVVEEFKAKEVHNLWNNVLFPADKDRNTQLGLYDFKKRDWILKGMYHMTYSHDNPTVVILQSKDTGKFGAYNLSTQSWDIPCEKSSLWEVTESDTSEYFSEIQGKVAIFRHEEEWVIEFSLPKNYSVKTISRLSDSERFRYEIGVHKDKKSYFPSEFFIVSLDWNIIAWPFWYMLRLVDGTIVFMKDFTSNEYTHINAETGNIETFQVPGKRLFTEEKEEGCYIVFEDWGKYGIKDLRGNIIVQPQKYDIENYFPISWNILLSRKIKAKDHPSTEENCPKKYQFVERDGKILIPWNKDLSGRMKYIDDKAYFSDSGGKLIYTSTTWKKLIRDIPKWWVQIEPTSENGIYIVDQDMDNSWHTFCLYNAENNTVYSYWRWLPVTKKETYGSFWFGSKNLTKLQNGYLIFGNSVITEAGKCIIPGGAGKIVPYFDSNWREIWVICHYRNSLMKVVWNPAISSISDMWA